MESDDDEEGGRSYLGRGKKVNNGTGGGVDVREEEGGNSGHVGQVATAGKDEAPAATAAQKRKKQKRNKSKQSDKL